MARERELRVRVTGEADLDRAERRTHALAARPRLAVGATAAVAGVAKTVKAASDLGETVNKTNVIFRGNAGEIQRWARGSYASMGLTRQQALANASALGDMFKQIGFGIPQAGRMSQGIVRLAADLGSFHNADITQVLEAQSAAFRGEYDSLQRFIPNINAARVQQVAMAQTGKANAQQLTAQEKALATYTIMMRDTKDAQGDFQRTSTGLANSGRILSAEWKEGAAILGQVFLPGLEKISGHLATKLGPNLLHHAERYMPMLQARVTDLAESFVDFLPTGQQMSAFFVSMERGAPRVGDFFARIGERAHQLGPALREAWTNFRSTRVESDDLMPTLRLSGALLGFVADHADTLARHIPLLVAGFVAYKGAQAAANVASAAQVALLPAQIAGHFALARANRTLAASYVQVGVAQGTAAAGGAAASAATAAGAGAAAGAASRWGGLATKLGLAGLALGAAASANTVLSKAQEYGHGIHARYVAPMYERLGIYSKERVAQLQQEAGVTRRSATASEQHATAMRNAATASLALKSALTGERDAGLDLRQSKINLARAQAEVTRLQREGRTKSLDYRQAQLDLRRAQIDVKDKTDAFRASVAKATDAERTAASAAQRAAPPTRNFGEAAETAGRKLNTMGRNAREGINKIPTRHHTDVSATARVVIDRATRQAITNSMAALRERPRAAGGPISGPGTGTSDSIPAQGPGGVRYRLSNGEHVWTAREVANAGGHQAMERMREQFRATGGPVSLASRVTGNFNGLRGWYGAVVEGTRVGAQRSITQIADLLERRLTQVVKAAAALGGGSAAIKAFIRSLDSHPYVWGGSGPWGYDCSGIVSAVLGKMLGMRGAGSGLRLFTTSSIRAGQYGLRSGLGGVLQIGVTPGRGHMAGRYGGLGFEAESTRTGIKIGAAASRPESFARHYFHLARGGRVDARDVRRLLAAGYDIGGDPDTTRIIIGPGVRARSFDQGGWLPPGMTLAVNATGRPEPVGAAVPSARSIAVALADVLEARGMGAVYLDGRKVSRVLAPTMHGDLRSLSRRGYGPVD